MRNFLAVTVLSLTFSCCWGLGPLASSICVEQGLAGPPGPPGPPGPAGRDGQDAYGCSCTNSCAHGNQEIYYNILTPAVLNETAAFDETPTLFGHFIKFGPSETSFQRLMSVTLVPPGQLQDDMTYVASITFVHQHPSSASAEHDPSFHLCDKHQCIGMWVFDLGNRKTQAPFEDCQGENKAILNCRTSQVWNSFRLPQAPMSNRHTMKIRFGNKSAAWGSLEAGYNGGLAIQTHYSRQINPSTGLYLQYYRDEANEQYLFGYVEVTIKA